MLYYGTEVGMWGADDPHNRKPMWWPELVFETEEIAYQNGSISYNVEPDMDYYPLLQELAVLRNKYKCLRYGSIEILKQSNSRILAYDRIYEGKRLRILMNPTQDAQKVELNAENLLLFKLGTIEEIQNEAIHLAPFSAVVVQMNS
jgi:glycosidase